jgi:hypothetical protein
MSNLMKMATSRMFRSNEMYGTEFHHVIHAAIVGRQIEAIVKDSGGFLWLCREDVGPLDGQQVAFLMPIWGPAPDPIDPLPAGYSPETTALMAESARISNSVKRRAA